MITIRTLLVDDEPLARRRLRTMLEDHADVVCAGEAEDAEEAKACCRTERPDLMFLDINLPGASGFTLLEGLHLTPAPYVIFVTAHTEYAVQAFDANAVDYLLKPFNEERLARSLDRARDALRRTRSGPYLERFAITLGQRTLFIKADQVDWIEGNGNYVRLHVGREKYLARVTMNALEHDLDPAKFARVHRSAIVQLDRVRELHSLGGDYRLLLSDGTKVGVTQRYRSRLP